MKVLVIDDSAFSRSALSGLLGSIPGVGAVSTAVDGLDGYRQALKFKPDLIILDLEMPNMDGFTFLRILNGTRRIPVIVITCRSWADAHKAFELGAFDFIEKPTAAASEDLFSIKAELARKVRLAPFRHASRERGSMARPLPACAPEVFAIGASTGGPRAVSSIVKSLPKDLPSAVIVSIHMPDWLTVPFIERLRGESAIEVREARDGGLIEKGSVVITPGGYNISFVRKGFSVYTRLTGTGEKEPCAPSIDGMFISAAKAWGQRLTGVIMTGMGADGAEGVIEIKKRGGHVIAESRETTVVFSMPDAAISTGGVDEVLPAWKIGESIIGKCGMKPSRIGLKKAALL